MQRCLVLEINSVNVSAMSYQVHNNTVVAVRDGYVKWSVATYTTRIRQCAVLQKKLDHLWF